MVEQNGPFVVEAFCLLHDVVDRWRWSIPARWTSLDDFVFQGPAEVASGAVLDVERRLPWRTGRGGGRRGGLRSRSVGQRQIRLADKDERRSGQGSRRS